jgi:hypothetical protein
MGFDIVIEDDGISIAARSVNNTLFADVRSREGHGQLMILMCVLDMYCHWSIVRAGY